MTGTLGSIVSGGVSGLFQGAAGVISSIGNYFIARRAITVIEPHLARVGRRGERLVRDGVVGGNRLVRDTGAGVERVARDVARSGERLVRDGATGGTNLVRSTGAGVERIARDLGAGGTSLIRDAGRETMKVANGIGGTFKEWGDNTGSFGKETVNKTFYTAQRWGDNIGRTATGGFLAAGIICLANKAVDVFFKHHQIAATACKADPESSYCLADRITAHLSIAGPLSAILVLGVAIYLAPRVIWREPVEGIGTGRQSKSQGNSSVDTSSQDEIDEESELEFEVFDQEDEKNFDMSSRTRSETTSRKPDRRLNSISNEEDDDKINEADLEEQRRSLENAKREMEEAIKLWK